MFSVIFHPYFLFIFQFLFYVDYSDLFVDLVGDCVALCCDCFLNRKKETCAVEPRFNLMNNLWIYLRYSHATEHRNQVKWKWNFLFFFFRSLQRIHEKKMDFKWSENTHQFRFLLNVLFLRLFAWYWWFLFWLKWRTSCHPFVKLVVKRCFNHVLAVENFSRPNFLIWYLD